MSEHFSARHISRLLSFTLIFGVLQASLGHADDQNQRRRRQQQQQQEQQQPAQRQQRFERPNVFAPQRYPVQQQPIQQSRAFTPFQPQQPRTAVNPNAQIYQPPGANPNERGKRPFANPNAEGPRTIGNPNPQAGFTNRQDQFRPNPNTGSFRQDRTFAPSTQSGRTLTTPVSSSPTVPGRISPVSGIQNGGGQAPLTRREVLSSPEDRDFLRGLTAQQRRQLDQLSPEQIQSLQQNGQWASTKQSILMGRASQTTQNGAAANPNGSSSFAAPSALAQGATATNTASGLTGNSANVSSPSNAAGISPSDMGPAAAMDTSGGAVSNNAVQAPAAPPPVAPPALQIAGFPPSFSASGGGSYQPTINLSGTGFTTMAPIVWTCFMPSGQPCTGNPYKWAPGDWSGKYVVHSDTSATVAPHLLAGGDPAGIYQWTVSFVGNGGKSFAFQLNNGGSAPPPSPPAPPVSNPPVAPPPPTNNPPSTQPVSTPPAPPSQQAAPVYTFNMLTNGNVEIYENGQRASTGTAQYAAQFGYRGPGWNGQVPTNNPPSPPPNAGPTPQPNQPLPLPVSAALQVSGISQYYSASGGLLQPSIRLSGSGFNSITQIIWTCVMPSGAPCTASPYVWTASTWNGRFSRYGDNSAMVTPKLLAGGDPVGTYQWTVSFIGNGGASLAFQVSNTGGANTGPTKSPPPEYSPPLPSWAPVNPPSFPSQSTSVSTPAMISPQQLAINRAKIDQVFSNFHADINAVYDNVELRNNFGIAGVGSNAVVLQYANELVADWAGFSAGGTQGLHAVEVVTEIQDAMRVSSDCHNGKSYNCMLGVMNFGSSELLQRLAARYRLPSDQVALSITISELMTAATTAYLYGFLTET